MGKKGNEWKTYSNTWLQSLSALLVFSSKPTSRHHETWNPFKIILRVNFYWITKIKGSWHSLKLLLYVQTESC